ncbi:MAG TPA: hypothetical protein PLF16_00480 [Candidatus Staskawiczbacteria bacterium]|nr:hypothetical protein [Candidatus Staskawiczbacteria bacterium]
MAFLFVCCVLALSATQSFAAGIVYSDGKNVFWYDLEGSYDNKPVNLTGHVPDIMVDKQAFAVSESGQTLVWLQGYKFWSMDLPKGTPRPFQMELWGAPKGTRTSSTSFALEYRDILWQRTVRNIVISPDESKVMFESVHNGLAWTYERMLTDPIPLQKAKDPSYRPGSDPTNPMLPYYVGKPASCIGIFAMSKDYNRCDAPGSDPYAPRYGNVCEWPPVPWYRHSVDARGSSWRTQGEQADDQGRIYTQRGTAKSALFPAFQPIKLWQEQKLMAFILQLPNGQWGPIELRTVDSPVFDRGYDNNPDVVLDRGTCGLISQEFGRLYPKSYRSPGHGASNCPVESKNYQLDAKYYQPRHWEIQIPALQSCNGIAWTPEGNLTILDGTGRLWKISSKEIQRVRYQSSITKDPNGLERGSFFLYPTNNMIRTTPELIGSDINGSNICWLSEQEFIFLGKDSCVYRCSKAGKQKIAGPLPGKFFYCQTSPLKSANAATSGKGEFCIRRPKDQKSDGPLDYSYMVGFTKFGHIAINTKRFSGPTVIEETGKVVPYSGPVPLWVGKIGCQPPLEYCLTDKTDLGQIKYPLDGYKFYYNYGLNTARGAEHIASTSMTGAEGDRINEAGLPPGKVMLLRLDKQYVIELLVQRHPSKEATFTYEWRTIAEPAASTSLADILSQARQTGATRTAAKPIKDSKDADIPTLKATFQRSFSERGMKFTWDRQGQHNEVVVFVSYKEEFDDNGGHTNIPKITVLADKAIEDIDLSGYKPTDYNKDPIVSNNTLDIRKNVPLGGVLLVRWKDFHIALRPLYVDGKTVAYKLRLIE